MSYILPNTESQTVEFKTSFQKEVINTIVAFSNSNGGKIYIGVSDNKKIVGVDISEETMKFIKTYMMLSYEFDGSIQRIEKWDYPIKALREAVLNAVVHRDYRDPSDIQIKIYDDKIVISSPGKLYDDMTLEKIKSKNYQSSLRNKLIAEAFYLTANTEKYGTGFIRIDKELENYPSVTYEFKEIANAMQFTFFKDIKNSGGVNEPLNEPLNDPLNKILELLKENNSYSYDDLAQKLNISKSTIKRNMQKLKSNGLIKRVGSDKTGHWELMDGKNK